MPTDASENTVEHGQTMANVLSRILHIIEERMFQRLGRGNAVVMRRGSDVFTTLIGSEIPSRVQAQHALQQVQRWTTHNDQ